MPILDDPDMFKMILSDILVIWRASAVCFDHRVVITIPLFWWLGLIGGHFVSRSVPGETDFVFSSLVDTIVPAVLISMS